MSYLRKQFLTSKPDKSPHIHTTADTAMSRRVPELLTNSPLRFFDHKTIDQTFPRTRNR